MAKHRAHRALFEMLAKDRQKGRPDVAARPLVAHQPTGREGELTAPRAAKPPRREPAAAARPTLPTVPGRAPVVIGGVGLTYGHLAVAGAILVCLCVLCYLVGARLAGDGLPVTEKHPTMDEIRQGPVTQGLIGAEPERPAPPPASPKALPRPSGQSPGPSSAGPVARWPERPAPQPAGPRPSRPPESAPAQIGTRTPGDSSASPQPTRPLAEPTTATPERPGPSPARPPTGPQYRVRIARLDVSQPDAIDRLRAFLSQSGVETELETRGGYHVLYSRERFPDKKKSDELAATINKALEAFEKQTRRPTSKDAYTILVTKE